VDKIVVEVIKTKEEFNSFYYIRGLLVTDYLYLLRVNLNFFIVIINLRYFIYFTLNLHFLILTYKPAFYSLSRTFLI